ETAWVDPQIQIWNSTLLDNLVYGCDSRPEGFESMLSAAGVHDVLKRLPGGFETVLGEGGGLVSGGEGQRVRAGRAMVRPDVRLVILDEPARGLDRQKRRRLIENARTRWRDTTMFVVTHDVAETKVFDRVLVIEDGRILEDGCPARLYADPASRYRSLCDAEDEVREQMWLGAKWRRFRMETGELAEVRD